MLKYFDLGGIQIGKKRNWKDMQKGKYKKSNIMTGIFVWTTNHFSETRLIEIMEQACSKTESQVN